MLLSEPTLDIDLSVSCVYYDTNQQVFEKTLESISIAITHAKTQNIINSSEIYLINNNKNNEAFFFESLTKFKDSFENIIIHNGHGNIGYGRANNLAIFKTQSKYHLILNPDIITTEDAITVGISYLQHNSNVGLVAPHATNINNETEYLAKRTPTFFTIFLRGINNRTLNRLFKKNLDAYAYKDKIPCAQPFPIELASGCFMLCRTDSLKQAGGFSKEYFLYFEDFDLSQKIRHTLKIFYLPRMKVQHMGGNAHAKSFKHHYLFLKSAFIYFYKI